MITLYRRGKEWTACACQPHTDQIRLKAREMFAVCSWCGAPLGIRPANRTVCPDHCITHSICTKCKDKLEGREKWTK